MAVSRRLRFEVLRRDGHTCRYCGGSAPDVKLTVDHVIPVTLGGSDDANNLVTACHGCNAGKASISPDSPIVEEVDATAMLFAKAMDVASERRRGALRDLEALVAQFDARWRSWSYNRTTANPDGDPIPRDGQWRASVERFLSNGLDIDDLARFVTVAMESKVYADKTWRYFCGCCWNEITERQELARRLIEDGQV